MLVGTSAFTETRDYFEKHKVYTKALRGTRPYYEFWDNEEHKCLNGVTIGNITIPGEYYFYLNFTRMLLLDPVTGKKRQGFPRFTDVDLEYFLIYKKANTPGNLKGIILLKPRRTGFSYKSAALATYEFNFNRDSVTCVGAYENKYSNVFIGGTNANLNFLTEHTCWSKPRNPDQLEKNYCKARHQIITEDGRKVWKGYQSEIWRLTFKDNASASIGKSASLFFFEECGQFPNIITSFELSEPTWKDGNVQTGIPILYGTGGDMGAGALAFSQMFYNPEEYGLLAFDNIWDDDTDGKKCGWFLPATRQRFGLLKDEKNNIILDDNKKPIKLVDDEGNSNIKAAELDIFNFRKYKKNARTSITEYPLKTTEGFLLTHGNNFPTILLKEQLSNIYTNPGKYIDVNWVGNLFTNPDTGKLEQRVDENLRPITRYPRTKDVNPEGGLIIYERPQVDGDGVVSPRRYIISIDPFDDDDVNIIDSLGSILVFDRLTARIVAEYTGRPRLATDLYEMFRKLIVFYNGVGFPEINKMGVVQYFENKKCMNLLAETPMQIRDKVEWKPGLNTSYGYKATLRTNNWGNDLIKSWLETPISTESEILNLHRLRSTGLLEELIKYHPDGNFDRISALRGCLILDSSMSQDYIDKTKAKVKSFTQHDYFKSLNMFSDKSYNETLQNLIRPL
jgi:hypothetical protein